jgi:ribosomal protein S18 acetylase RimI-like enzyme
MTNTVWITRRALVGDVPFLAQTDLAVDMEDADDSNEPMYFDGWGEAERDAHRAKIATFVTDEDKSAWVVDDSMTSRPVGMILSRCHQGLIVPDGDSYQYLFRLVDEGVLPADVPFGEVFQLWVDPAYRRRGIATDLKRRIEVDGRTHGAKFLYTHTRASNQYVVTLNLKLGYTEVRHGAWFFEDDRPDAFHPQAAKLAWERTLQFLDTQ